jgi:hypothetical protein
MWFLDIDTFPDAIMADQQHFATIFSFLVAIFIVLFFYGSRDQGHPKL